jgi:signal transduction histidine kinase
MPLAPVGHLILAFPIGRLTSRFQQVVVGMLYVWVGFLANLLRALFTDYFPRNPGLCPDCTNVFMIRDDPALHDAFATADALIGAALAVSIIVVVVRRWLSASEAMRRVLRPVWWGLWPVMLVAAYLVALDLVDVPDQAQLVAIPFTALALTGLPVAFLLGLLRIRLDRSLIGDLLIGLEGPMAHGRIREALAEALGDPSLRLAFWLPEQKRYVDEEGRRLDLSGETGQDRHLTHIEDSKGSQLAVLFHDSALLEDQERLDAVAGAARLALENERLHAELQAQLQEVRESRARVVEAGDHARQRLERDLHDGAQQRLLALSLAIERARALGDGEDRSRLDKLLSEASAELKETLAELRELARGIHPALLTDEGLGPAVEALARRAALPTRVMDAPSERFSPAVEAAAYFIISEGLANAAKHSNASEATVSIEASDGWLVVEVSDDGEGGAKFDSGSGLVGLEDRVVSLGGEFVLRSSPGMGTKIHARLPHDHTNPAGG